MLTYKGDKLRGPKALIQYFYNEVNLKSAFFVVLIAILLEFLVSMIIKAPNLLMQFVGIVYSKLLISWIVLGFAIYLFVYFVKGKKKLRKGDLQKIFTGLSAFRIPSIVFVVGSYLITVVFYPGLITLLRNVSANPNIILSSTSLGQLTGFNIFGLVLMFILAIVIYIYWVVMFYHLSAEIFKEERFWYNVIYVIIFFIISSIVSFIFI